MKIALLGTSHWHAQMHLEAATSAGAEIVAVWDAAASQAAAFAARFDLPLAVDPQAALRGADLVVLMGHPESLPGLAQQAIAARVPMVLEKPAACKTGELLALREAAALAGAFVGIPLANRFGPAMVEYQRLRQSGVCQEVRHAGFRLINGPPQRYRNDGVGWILDLEIGGGGALRNLGIHGIDAANAIAEGKLRICSSHVGRRIHVAEAVEDHAVVVLADEADAIFVVEAGYTFASMAPGGDFEWRIATQGATIVDRGDAAWRHDLTGPAVQELKPEPTATRYRLFMADTLARLAAGRPPAVTLDDYVTAMQLIDEAYRSAAE